MNRARKLMGSVLIAAGLSLALLVPHAVAARMVRILHSFAGGTDGKGPYGNLSMDQAGTLYGTTVNGGGSANCFNGCGTVYKLTADGQESVIYAFQGGADGYAPGVTLLIDGEGNLYGAAAGGDYGLGLVFKLTKEGTKATLHSFAGGTDDGGSPNGDLLADADWNLYGVTITGGTGDCTGGCGTVFKITSDGEESILYSFAGGSAGDGSYPSGGLVMDAAGNLFGPTLGGGIVRPACSHEGCGTVFQLTSDGQETIVYRFRGEEDGSGPSGRLAIDAEGNLYGTTARGGTNRREVGTIYKLAPDGSKTLLHSFQIRPDGYTPSDGVILDEEGNLYGVSYFGGPNFNGIVYRVTPEGDFSSIHAFTEPLVEGYGPRGRLLLDNRGILYGTNLRGGAAGDNGTVFALHK